MDVSYLIRDRLANLEEYDAIQSDSHIPFVINFEIHLFPLNSTIDDNFICFYSFQFFFIQ